MFKDVRSIYQQNKVVTGVTGVAATTGLVYALTKKKSLWGTVGITAAFALVGYIGTASIIKLTSKS